MEEKSENKKEPKKVNIGNYKKIDNILDNDRLIKIYGLLPDKESKREFLETVLSTYEDRLAEKFHERLEDEFEANDSQIKQGQLKENIRNKRSIEDILRSRRREPLTQGATERINHLIAELQKGNYISKEDREFLAKHLAERSNVEGTSPSSRREEIRTTIDTYIKAKNKENRNRANSYNDKQDSQKNIRDLKRKLEYKILHQNDPITYMEANGANYGEDINEDPYIRVTKRREKEIQDIKSQIAQLEELQDIEETSNPLNSMLNMPDPEFDVEKNNIDLEELMGILDRESAELLKNGVELPKTGIKEDDVVEMPEDDEQIKDTIQVDETKTQERPAYVVNAQASLEQKYDKNNNVTVVEPTLGTSIEDFAEAIMKNKQDSKQIVARFNDFEINSNDYQNAEELIQAYEKHVQEHSSETKKITSKQEKITPSEIESVVAINPRALQIMSEVSATKQLVRADEQEKDVEFKKNKWR